MTSKADSLPLYEFPDTYKSSWCGEWQPKEKKKKTVVFSCGTGEVIEREVDDEAT